MAEQKQHTNITRPSRTPPEKPLFHSVSENPQRFARCQIGRLSNSVHIIDLYVLFVRRRVGVMGRTRPPQYCPIAQRVFEIELLHAGMGDVDPKRYSDHLSLGTLSYQKCSVGLVLSLLEGSAGCQQIKIKLSPRFQTGSHAHPSIGSQTSCELLPVCF